MKWLIAFLIFSLLILFHEFGHFLAARLNGVEVEEFSLGFGPRLISARRGGTRYSLKLLLFGGSCRMKGMLTDFVDEEEEGSAVPEEGSYQNASAGRRAAIIFAGPFFNFLLAFICSVIVISVVGYDPAVITYVGEGTASEKAGLQAGDVITSFNGQHVAIGRDVDTWFIYNDLKSDEEVTVTYERDGESYTVEYLPDTSRRYLLGLTYMMNEEEAVIDAVSVGSPLDEANVYAGDVIIAVNGTEIADGQALYDYFSENPLDGSSVTLSLRRGSREFTKEIVPVYTDDVRLGFSYNLGRVKTTPLGVLRYSFTELRYWITTTVRSVGALFTGRFSVDDLSGPVGVVDVVGTTYEETKDEGALMTWMNMLNLIILLSANLGVMNLLPIPALDGGRLLFLLLEGLRGKPLSQSVEAAIQTAAAVLLMLLMVYVMYHDISGLLLP